MLQRVPQAITSERRFCQFQFIFLCNNDRCNRSMTTAALMNSLSCFQGFPNIYFSSDNHKDYLLWVGSLEKHVAKDQQRSRQENMLQKGLCQIRVAQYWIKFDCVKYLIFVRLQNCTLLALNAVILPVPDLRGGGPRGQTYTQ